MEIKYIVKPGKSFIFGKKMINENDIVPGNCPPEIIKKMSEKNIIEEFKEKKQEMKPVDPGSKFVNLPINNEEKEKEKKNINDKEKNKNKKSGVNKK